MVQYSTKMIFAVLDVSLIMGLNIDETDKKIFTLITYLLTPCKREQEEKI